MKKTVAKEISVRFENITKTFGSVIANENITFDVYKGEILSLLGENGSGKTTLMNMLSGIYFPDDGKIYVNGKHVSISSPMDAFALKIGMVHQHFKLIDVFSCLENIVLGIKDKEKADMRNAAVAVRKICDKYGFELNLSKKVYEPQTRGIRARHEIPGRYRCLIFRVPWREIQHASDGQIPPGHRP